MDALTKLEEQVKNFIALKDEKKSIENKMEQLKDFISKTFEEVGEDKVYVFLNEDESIKIEKSIRSSRKIDKERLAEDLDVSEDVIKQDFLLKAVEDRKLTFDKYKEYYYVDQRDNIAIRKVKMKPKGKK